MNSLLPLICCLSFLITFVSLFHLSQNQYGMYWVLSAVYWRIMKWTWWKFYVYHCVSGTNYVKKKSAQKNGLIECVFFFSAFQPFYGWTLLIKSTNTKCEKKLIDTQRTLRPLEFDIDTLLFLTIMDFVMMLMMPTTVECQAYNYYSVFI